MAEPATGRTVAGSGIGAASAGTGILWAAQLVSDPELSQLITAASPWLSVVIGAATYLILSKGQALMNKMTVNSTTRDLARTLESPYLLPDDKTEVAKMLSGMQVEASRLAIKTALANSSVLLDLTKFDPKPELATAPPSDIVELPR